MEKKYWMGAVACVAAGAFYAAMVWSLPDYRPSAVMIATFYVLWACHLFSTGWRKGHPA